MCDPNKNSDKKSKMPSWIMEIATAKLIENILILKVN
jgi:hypothetical protein